MPIITGDETTELQTAHIALGLWSGACQDVLVPFGTSASSVFGGRVSGTIHFLRLTDRSFRSLEDATDEMSFLASGLFGLLLHLRLLYVYCDRLHSFGFTPRPEQMNILGGFRDRLICGEVW